MLTFIVPKSKKFKTCAYISVAGLVATSSWSATESVASNAAQPGHSLTFFTPSFYPPENEWRVTGGLARVMPPSTQSQKFWGGPVPLRIWLSTPPSQHPLCVTDWASKVSWWFQSHIWPKRPVTKLATLNGSRKYGPPNQHASARWAINVLFNCKQQRRIDFV